MFLFSYKFKGKMREYNKEPKKMIMIIKLVIFLFRQAC